VNGDYKSSTLVALYSIYKEERLFQEFMDTIVMDKLNSIDKIIKPSDMTLFLTNIGSSDGSVANWKDSTRKKLWSVFKRILINSGVIDNKCRIKRQIINPALKDLFIKNGDYKFIKCIF
jgi:acetone carboxylase gamma subunit